MAKKAVKYFECSSCGHREPKWSGRCTSCGEWNSFVEKHPAPSRTSSGGTIGGDTANAAAPVKLSDVESGEGRRISSGMVELDRVLGGGVMGGSSVLLGGEPGIGKSTLMLQAADAYSRSGPVLYISGEEAQSQIKMRASRLGIQGDRISLLSQSSAELCSRSIQSHRPGVIIVDSIQTLGTEESSSSPGSPNQVKHSVQIISEAAREVNACVFFIAHVTKEGAIAGPKLVEHLVDAVLYFDHSQAELRFLRANKNRFGSSDEIGIFTMGSDGLTEVGDPGRLFLSEEEELPAGTSIVPVYEGSRILMVEIQALTVPGKGGFGRVYSDMIDQRRVNRVAAVLEKHANLRFSDQDLYVNVAGGIRIQDVGTELGLAMALYSARTGMPLPAATAFCGEISLSGQVRSISHLRRRIQQAGELGYKRILAPPPGGLQKNSQESPAESRGAPVLRVRSISETVTALWGKG